MNPMSNVKGITRLNEKELTLGVAGSKTSWHNQYKDSAWIFVGGLPYDLSEGDVICVFSQYGEMVNVNLVRDKSTGKFKGYGFLCYQDQRSTTLAVDNLNGIKLLGRTIRVDHVSNYRKPKEFGDEDEITKQLRDEGCAPKYASSESEPEEIYVDPVKKAKKEKKKKKEKKPKKKLKKKQREAPTSDSDSSEEESNSPVKIKPEKHDLEYDKYADNKHSGHRSKHVDKEVNKEKSEKYDKHREKHHMYEKEAEGRTSKHDKDRSREKFGESRGYRDDRQYDRDRHDRKHHRDDREGGSRINRDYDRGSSRRARSKSRSRSRERSRDRHRHR